MKPFFPFYIFVTLILCNRYSSAQWSKDTSTTKQISNFGVSSDVCSDGEGGAYLGFKSFISGKGRLYIQRVDKYGYVQWPTPLMVLDTMDELGGYIVKPKGFNGIITAMTGLNGNLSQGYTDSKIFLQKIDKNKIWHEDGIKVTSDTIQHSLRNIIADDSGGVVVTWLQGKKYGFEIINTLHIQRISAEGKKLWGDHGIQITDSLGTFHEIVSLTKDGFTVLYSKKNQQSILLKINYFGQNHWSKVLSDNYKRFYSIFTTDKYGNSFLAGYTCIDSPWCENISFVTRKIDENGNDIWLSDKAFVDSIQSGIVLSDIGILEGINNKIYIYYGSYAQFLDTDGNKLLPSEKIRISSFSQGGFNAIGSDSNSVIFLMSDTRTGKTRYYVQKLNIYGERLWSENDVLLSSYEFDGHPIQFGRIITDTKGGILSFGILEAYFGVYGQQVNKYGEMGNVITTVKQKSELNLSDFIVLQNYPNPFNPLTTITYSIPRASNIVIKVYDMLGKEVTALVNRHQASGRYSIDFDGLNLSSGMYIYKLTAGEFTEVRKMMLLK